MYLGRMTMPRSYRRSSGAGTGRRRIAAGLAVMLVLGCAVWTGLARDETLSLDIDAVPAYVFERAGGGMVLWVANPVLY